MALADRLVLELTHVDRHLVAHANYHDQSGASHAPLAFDSGRGLPAVLKLLNAEQYSADDYSSDESAWLRGAGFVVAGADQTAVTAVGLRRSVGERLMASLLPTNQPARDIFERAYEETGPTLPVELRFDADDALLGAAPWELLRYNDDFLFRGGRGSLCRRLDYPRPLATWQPLAVSQLRVLMIAPRPSNVVPLDEADLQALKSIDQLKLDFLPRPTMLEFTTYLQKNRGPDAPHIIHFDGHGTFGRKCASCGMISPRLATTCRNEACTRPMLEETSKGYLAWETARGNVDFVSTEDIADPLSVLMRTTDSALRLMVVSACKSAVAASGGSAFTGVAQRLIKANVPAVIAMQFEIRADEAATFAQVLYRGLAAGDSISEALVWARTGLREEQQWDRPVLYLRTKDEADGRFFEMQATDSRLAAVADTSAPSKTKPIAVDVSSLSNDSDGRLIELLERGTEPLIRESAVVEAIKPYVSDFTECIDRLEALADYKELHDGLHKVYLFCALPLRDQLSEMTQDQVVHETMRRQAHETRQQVSAMRRVARNRPDDPELDWVEKLATLADNLQEAVDNANPAPTRRALDWILRLLEQQLTHMNDLLIGAADALRLDKIREAMLASESVLRAASVEYAADALSVGASASRVIEDRLDALLTEHRAWQAADSELEDLGQLLLAVDDMEGFLGAWPDLSVQLRALAKSHDSEDAKNLQASCVTLDALVPPPDGFDKVDSAAVRNAFRRCVTDANQRFFNVDSDVRTLSSQLRPLGGLLDAAARGAGAISARSH
jgi:hypothetical protein